MVTTGLRAFRALVSRLNLSADGASSVLYASAIGLVFDWGNALTEVGRGWMAGGGGCIVGP